MYQVYFSFGNKNAAENSSVNLVVHRVVDLRKPADLSSSGFNQGEEWTDGFFEAIVGDQDDPGDDSGEEDSLDGEGAAIRNS